jgi:hypothetical protein
MWLEGGFKEWKQELGIGNHLPETWLWRGLVLVLRLGGELRLRGHCSSLVLFLDDCDATSF